MTDPAPHRLRLFGRGQSRPLSPWQKRLMTDLLPAITLADPSDPQVGFDQPRPLVLEIGFGAGEHLLDQARRAPGCNHIGAEVFINGIAGLLSKLWPVGHAHPESRGNLCVWTRDVRVLLPALPAGCLTRVDLLFPDPWPKARHAERRMVNPVPLAWMAAALARGGTLCIASDDPTYQAWVDEIMRDSKDFMLEARGPDRPAWRIASRYEAKAARAGRHPLWWQFRRS
jgi:tRNA (guanine-N7-)-methyltransferase